MSVYSKYLLLLFFLAGALGESLAQQHYYIYLKDKAGVISDYETYFDTKALERRAKIGQVKSDFYDLPLNQGYVQQISQIADSLRYQLRWLNALTATLRPEQYEAIRKLPFVVAVEPFREALRPAEASEKPSPEELDKLYAAIRSQLGLDALQKQHLSGIGVRIAILDAGFKQVDIHSAFSYLAINDRILATKDFLHNEKEEVFRHSSHGAAVLACIGGRYKNKPFGAAPDAQYLLARTEHALLEFKNEEDHWFAAMEWADRRGADIIHSSLGYSHRRYPYEQVDGYTARVTKAAQIACRKGILVVNSAGNSGGQKKGRHIQPPADADSVLAVGATYPRTYFPTEFTSPGPNFRGVLKPELTAPGYVVVPKGKLGYTSLAGTSFSAPLITGIAACLMQQYPEYTAQQIKEMLINSGHLYPYYDYHLGYGIPNVETIFEVKKETHPSFELYNQEDSVVVLFLQDSLAQADTAEYTVLHYHWADSTGRLSAYGFVPVPKGAKAYRFPKRKEENETMRIWYQGYLEEISLKSE